MLCGATTRMNFVKKSLNFLSYDAGNLQSFLCGKTRKVPESQRADAANSLVYEANVRLRDPVYGCMGAISALQQQVQSLQAELNLVRSEILKHKYRDSDIIPSSHIALFSSGVVSIASPPPAPPPPPPPLPPASSSSSLYTPLSTATNYSTMSNDQNVPYFG
ncbi:LOB domain-containing protein 15 [Actinidia rufa]|uniref:LOB domain-containing protein 15 n=1 Tax=Actinidia rufa TaxID=165716 RepID=A0A7J0E6D4_9ERIC|nr:LOB domain-containing protein 15 [Actinidia rufa]